MLLTWIEISKKALLNNIAQIKKNLPKKTKFMAVVKDNAYGHGLFEVVNAIKNNVNYLATFHLEDAISMRQKGVKLPILMLSRIFEDQIDLAIKHDIIATISTLDILQKTKKPLRCHICVDTGLGRDGFLFSQLEEVLAAAKKSKLKIEGIYSHFAAADDVNETAYTKAQIEKLLIWKRAFVKNNFKILTHQAASAGSLMGHSNAEFDLVRVGIALYGNWPSLDVQKACEKKIKLTPVLTWKTIITELRHLKKGDKISYNCTYQLKKNSTLATLPIGYSDGISRVSSNKSFVLIGGKKCPQIGRVTMNLIIIDVSDVKNVKIGDEAVIIGAQGRTKISASEMGAFAQTSSYEALARISSAILRKVL